MKHKCLLSFILTVALLVCTSIPVLASNASDLPDITVVRTPQTDEYPLPDDSEYTDTENQRILEQYGPLLVQKGKTRANVT